MKSLEPNPQLAAALAINRVEARCKQAEEELPKLAAPDGTVAVQIDDLRALLNAYDQVLLDCNKAKRRWAARWYGSPPMRGSTLMALTEHGDWGKEIAYFGDVDGVHKLVSHIAFLHNQALNEAVDSASGTDRPNDTTEAP